MCLKVNAAGVRNFSIVWRTLRSDKCRRSKRGSTKCGNCEEGKKAGQRSNITSFQVNNLTCNSKFWLCCFTGEGGNVDLNYSSGRKYILYIVLSAIVSALPSPVTINERGILNLIPCENKGNRAHVVNKISYIRYLECMHFLILVWIFCHSDLNFLI